MSLGILILRLTLAVFLFGHGAQKLFGWFGGGGIRKTAEGYESRGFRPAMLMAVLAGVSEAGGAVLLAAGAAVPLAVVLVVSTMTVAISTHKRTPWSHHGGFELPLSYAVSALVVCLAGPGEFSVDRLFGFAETPLYVGFAAAAVGLLGGLAVVGIRAATNSARSTTVS